MNKDYYKLLGLDKNASAEDIKRAYRKLAMQYHPDRGGGAEAEKKFKEINEAYKILSDPQKRAQYDQFGSSAFNGANGFGNQGFGGFDFSGFQSGGFRSGGVEFNFGGLGDIFEDFFGQAFATVNTELEISPAQAVLGDNLKIKVGNETINFDIPAGVQNGMTFQIPGKGHTLRNGKKGDLNITLKIKMPVKINEEQKILWQKLRESESKKRSWWQK